MQSFITGSQVYGKPTAESDIDLVLLVESETETDLVEMSDDGGYPVRFGKLNLILVQDPVIFNKWKECTEHLIDIGPVTRGVAVGEFNKRGITGYKAADMDDPNTLELSSIC